jgi:hypothetical protein
MANPVLDLPEGKGPFRFVIQHHVRGKSVHTDIRFEVNDHLIGLTLDDPGSISNKPKLNNDSKFSSSNKILAQFKSRQPKEWLDFSGEIPPGEVGATKYLPAKFIIIDSGEYEMGAQKTNLLEVFLHGKKFNGRFIASYIPLSAKWEKAGKNPLVWFFWKPIDQNPYVLSQRGISKNYIPPKDYSALPKAIEEKIPKELRWFEKGYTGEKASEMILEIRKLFLKRNILSAELRSAQFVLQKRSWQGRKIIRDTPTVFFDLRWESGDGLDCLILDSNPLESSEEINGVRERVNKKWLDFSGEIPPGEKGNPNKSINAKVDIIDKGRVNIEDSEDVISFRFHGSKLKGFWSAKNSDGRWIFQRSNLPKANSGDLIDELKIKKILEMSNNPEYSLKNIADEIGCSKSTIRYHIAKLGVK